MSVMTAIVLAILKTFASIYLDSNHPDGAAGLALAASYLIYAAFFHPGGRRRGAARPQ
jgi:hypothetical protein